MFIGSVVNALAQWGMLGALTKISSAEVVGRYALAVAVTGPVIYLAWMNLRVIQATDARREHEFGDYLGLRVATLLMAGAVIALIASVVGYPGETLVIIAFLTLSRCCDGISDIFYGLLQVHENFKTISISRILQGVLQCGLFIGLVYKTGSLLWGTVGMAAASGLVTLCYDIPRGRGVQRRYEGEGGWTMLLPRWRYRPMAHLVRVSLPLAISMGIMFLNVNIPRYFVEYYLGPGKLGIFASLSQIMIVQSQLLMGTIVQAALPRLALYHVQNTALFQRLFWQIVAVAVGAGTAAVVVAALWGRRILTILYRPEYGEYPTVFAWLTVGALIFSVVWAFDGGLIAMRRFQNQGALALAVALTTAGACVWLIPRSGLLGAAWAVDLGLTVKLLGNVFFFFHYQRRGESGRPGKSAAPHRLGPARGDGDEPSAGGHPEGDASSLQATSAGPAAPVGA